MLASGWNEDVADRGDGDHAARPPGAARRSEQGLPPAVPVPDPQLDEAPLYLDAGDRRVCVLQAMYNPRVVVFGGLLSDEECEALIELAKPRLARSLTVATKTGGEEVNADRTSNGMFFQRGENELVRRIEARIARLVNWPEENGEGPAGAALPARAPNTSRTTTTSIPIEPGTPTILKRGGQRVGTLVMYLGEPEKGGGTSFPDVHLEVAPKRGNAVFFSYERAHPSTTHACTAARR